MYSCLVLSSVQLSVALLLILPKQTLGWPRSPPLPSLVHTARRSGGPASALCSLCITVPLALTLALASPAPASLLARSDVFLLLASFPLLSGAGPLAAFWNTVQRKYFYSVVHVCKYLYSTLTLTSSLAGHRIPGWKLCPFRILKTWL